jgi:hypothetical protein
MSSPLRTVLPNIEVSRVKLFVIFSSFQATTLAVFNLHLSILNLQSLKLNRGATDENILGRSLVFVQDSRPSLAALLQP